MRSRHSAAGTLRAAGRLPAVTALAVAWLWSPAFGADHNDPNAVNSIYHDIPISPADLYDFFGFPSDDTSRGERVVMALTFASIPQTGVFDPDLLYRILVDPDPRPERPRLGEPSLEAMLEYAEAVGEKFLKLEAAEVRVTFDRENRAQLKFMGFPGGDFQETVTTNEVHVVESPRGHSIDVYVGGRDDAFFNDLPGFFRSINYLPQFYKVPHSMRAMGETPIPKTLLELEGNRFFNYDPAVPGHGRGVKLDLPDEEVTWSGDRFKRDEDGNFRFVYSGEDAQSGIDVNAIILELPLAFLTDEPERDRVVNAWGESWVLKAADKVETVPDEGARPGASYAIAIALAALGVLVLYLGLRAGSAPDPGASWWRRRGVRIGLGALLVAAGIGVGAAARFLAGYGEIELDAELQQYKLVDTDGVPFEDAALSERHDDLQLGANNLKLARRFVIRTAHLGWGFGPSIAALGLRSSFDHDDAPVSIHRLPRSAALAFPRVKKTLFQHMNMPDDSWNKSGKDIPLKRVFEIFIPNVCAIDMDTTGTWPFGRRLEDQVATRFLSVFLDMEQEIGGKPVHVETLSDQALWDAAPIVPKTPPNPLVNDKPFLDRFPYLAEPWENP